MGRDEVFWTPLRAPQPSPVLLNELHSCALPVFCFHFDDSCGKGDNSARCAAGLVESLHLPGARVGISEPPTAAVPGPFRV